MKKMNRIRLLSLAAGLVVLLNSPASAVQNLVSYQGRITTGTTNFTGPGQFKFALVSLAPVSGIVWRNSPDGNSDGVPDDAVPVPVTKGLYSVLLGDTALDNMEAILPGVWDNPHVSLRIWFSDGTNGFQLLNPDQRIAPQGYLASGSVTAAKLAPGAGGTWQTVSTGTHTAVPNMNYAASGSLPTAFHLPTFASTGDVIQISGAGPGGWSIASGGYNVVRPWVPQGPSGSWRARFIVRWHQTGGRWRRTDSGIAGWRADMAPALLCRRLERGGFLV